MNNIKTQFSIRDLENLSGIKAHTIRIWEKRYNLFQPNRSDTNIRYYSLKSLQKILNISYLNKNGLKISKIADLDEEEIPLMVKSISEKQFNNNYAINAFKMAMFSFDSALFHATYNKLSSKHEFNVIFYTYIVPFLDEIGLLWQTNTITPAHEHFIVELIKQKILSNTEKVNATAKNKNIEQTFVLFLPMNEIHELGLLFINYELCKNGLHSIYLGQSVPMNSLEHLTDYYDNITFISSFTVKPNTEFIDTYLEKFHSTILMHSNNILYVSGRQTQNINLSTLNDKISVLQSTKAVLDSLQIEKLKVN
ncbi:MerR family transcriptional regulator [Lacinutrix chionoecetis]